MPQTCPFEKGRRYKVLKDVAFLNHGFKKDTEVVFDTYAYDFHDGFTRYWFSNVDGSESNIWHVFDRGPDSIETWTTIFEPI